MRAVPFLLLALEASAGYVTLRNDSGVWWFVHDGGTPFLSLAVNHLNNGGLDDGVGTS